MEEAAPSGLFRNYYTPNEMINARSKKTGENIVPLGCFYDPGEAVFALEKTLNDQLSIVFEKLNSKIRETYPEAEIHYEGSVYHVNFKGVKLSELIELTVSEIRRCPWEDFQLTLNIDLVKNLPNDVELWGTQVSIHFAEHHWIDVYADDELPVCGLSVEGEILYLEHAISDRQITNIVDRIIASMENDYRLTYQM